MKLAVHLAKEVAAILRAVLTHETKKLYNDSTVHLLCSNYWIQPIYQELLHSSSRHNATRECERKRPMLRISKFPHTGCHDCVSGFPPLDIFCTVVWLGLATCWRRSSERNLSVGSLHAPVLCFTRFHQVLGWSRCLALSTQMTVSVHLPHDVPLPGHYSLLELTFLCYISDGDLMAFREQRTLLLLRVRTTSRLRSSPLIVPAASASSIE